MKVKVFWHHVGREHGLGEYTSDIRANPPEVIAECLQIKESRAGEVGILLDPNTIVKRGEGSIIVYFIDQGLQYSRGVKRHPGWLIDIVSVVRLESGAYRPWPFDLGEVTSE